MLKAKDFRKIARDGLKGRWPVAVVAGLIATMLGGTTNTSNGITYKLEQQMDQMMEGFAADPSVSALVAALLSTVALVAAIYTLVYLIVGGAVSLGYAKFNLNLINNNNPDIKDVFSQFNRFKTGFVMVILRTVYIFLWSLLFIIPGIIATYSYAMTPYILMENPDMTANEALKASKELMKGNKWRLFSMQFSFIGWDILCGFTAGIGYLVLNPYRAAADAAFYREIKWEKYKRDFDAQNASDTANA